MPYRQIPRNRPIATLIKWYADKKSGKVTDARNEIQKRFDFLDWKDQKRIIMAFLQSGKTDRQWAYRKIYSLWDDSYLQPVKELWEKYHEEVCAWSVIQHFPLDYVKANAEKLEEVNHYYHLCMRLAEEPDYHIDKTKLYDRQYLLVMLNAHREVSEEEAESIFFRSLYRHIQTDVQILTNIRNWGRGCAFSVFNIDFINSLENIFRQLDLDNLVVRLRQWDHDRIEEMLQGEEFAALNQEAIDDETYYQRRLSIGLHYINRAIDDKYKRPNPKLPLCTKPATRLLWGIEPDEFNEEGPATAEPPVFRNPADTPEAVAQIKSKFPAVSTLINEFELEVP